MKRYPKPHSAKARKDIRANVSFKARLARKVRQALFRLSYKLRPKPMKGR